MRDPDFYASVIHDFERRLEVVENRDLRNVAIIEGGITVGSAFVGELPDGTLGLGYVYDGELISAATVASMHKATLATQGAELTSQAGSIGYLAGIATAHSDTLATHGSTLSSHGGSISWLNNEVSSQAGSILSVAGALGTTNGRVGSLESAMSGVQSGLSSAQGSISSLQSAVGGQAGTNAGFQAALNSMAGDLAVLTGAVNRLVAWAKNGGGPGGPPFNDGA